MTHKEYIEEKVRRTTNMIAERIDAALATMPFKSKSAPLAIENGQMIVLGFGDGIGIKVTISVDHLPELTDEEIVRVVPEELANISRMLWPELSIVGEEKGGEQ